MQKKVIWIICSIIFVMLIIGVIYYFSNYSNTLVDPNEIVTDPNFKDVTYNQEGNILSDDILGILTIDKIGLKANVKEGSDTNTLKEYIGHIENTSMYDGNIRFSRT